MTLNVRRQHDAQYIAPTFDGRISEQKYPQATISLDLSMDINKTVHPEDGTLEVPGLHPLGRLLTAKSSFRRAIDRDLETRGISLSLV
ncbi:hypothetical protein C0995_007899 [Termitomyces sp. Mi166|nr:hypothetical protein C0995_007899 [Termitomyces sp. Mi166\